MKPLGSHIATEGTNGRREQEFRMALKRAGKCVLGRKPTCNREVK
jgi:hypothetical protein